MPLVNYLGDAAAAAAAAAAVAGLRATGCLHAETAQAAGGGLNRAAHLPAEHPRGEAVCVYGVQGSWGAERGGRRLDASEGCAGEGPPAVSTDCCVVGGPRWLALSCGCSAKHAARRCRPTHSNAIELTEQLLPLAPTHPVPAQAVDLPVEASEAVALPALGVQPSVSHGCSQPAQEAAAMVAEAAVMVGKELPMTPLRGSCALGHSWTTCWGSAQRPQPRAF